MGKSIFISAAALALLVGVATIPAKADTYVWRTSPAIHATDITIVGGAYDDDDDDDDNGSYYDNGGSYDDED